ncbi:MAG TPA: hypothetical protein ENI33_00335 [Thermoplasmatales archaeon]|nr:hypothetical protein [Thermoplasmatales archaeon]
MRIAFLFLLLFFLIPVSFSINSSANEPFPHLINLQIDAIGDAVAEVEPNEKHVFQFKFYNGGAFQTNLYLFYVEFSIEVEGEGWNAYVSPTWDYFYPNEIGIGRVQVTASSRPSNYATIHLHGVLKDLYGGRHPANFTFQVKCSQYHFFDVITNQTFIRGRQEEIYSVPIKIINCGNYEDRFYINPVYAPARWKLGVSQSPIIIPPGGEAIVYLHFAIPPEKIYIQQRTHFIMVNVQAENVLTSKAVAIIVTVEGFHLTLAHIVALLSSLPSLLLLAFVGSVMYRQSNPITYIPKPWREEKEELSKISKNERRKIIKEMKEEWKSSKYFLKEKIRDDKIMEKLKKARIRKQKNLEGKIKKEWIESWHPTHEEWKNECEKIKREYEKLKDRVNEKIKKANRMGIKVEIDMPSLIYPPKPEKLAMPKIPEYRIDERRRILIEPDEIEIERIMMPVRRKKALEKREIIKIREASKEILERIKQSFDVIEKKIDAEMAKLSKKSVKSKEELEKIKRKFKK